MNLNKASRYGLSAVVMMAQRQDELITAARVAETNLVSENHVAKVLQQLARAGIVRSVRGASGGYQLAKNPRELTMLEVVEALEGPVRSKCGGCEMVEGPADTECVHYHRCSIRAVMEEMAEQAYYTMKSVTVATLAKGPQSGVEGALERRL